MDYDYGMVIHNKRTEEFYSGSNLWVKPLKKARIFTNTENIKSTIEKCIQSGSITDKSDIEVLEVAIVISKAIKID